MSLDILIKAIKIINPSAEFTIIADDIDSIVWENGTEAISKEDIQSKMAEAETLLEQETLQETNKKTSANAKLLGLGLSQEEITALTGYKPTE